MKLQFYFIKLALAEFKVHKRRLILTTLAIAWGTFTILLLLAFGEGLKREMMRGNKGIGENLVVMWGGQTSRPYQGLPAGRRISFNHEDIELLKKSIPEIKSVSGEYNQWDTDASIGQNQRSIMVVGVDDEFGEMRNQIPQMGSRFLHPGDIDQKRRVVFMGWEVIKKFFKDEDAVGKTIIINKLPFIIVGILKEKIQTSNYNNMDQDKSYIPSSTFEAMYGQRNYNNLVYSLYDMQQSKAVEKRIYQVLGAKHRFDPTDEMALQIWDVIEMHKIMGKVMMGLQIFLGFIGALTLIISGVGLANIMYVSIKERTREIGTKIALGAHPRQILYQIISESFFFSIIGGFLGTLSATAVIETVKRLPITDDALAFLTHPTLSIGIGIVTSLILLGVTFLAGFFPARRAAMQNPIESLRYE